VCISAVLLGSAGKAGADAVVGTVTTGQDPSAIAIDSVTNMIYVANENGTVTVINGSTNATTTITAGATPHAIAVNPATNMIYVANLSSNNVTVINGSTDSTTTISVGTNPYSIAVNPATNMIYVANYGDGGSGNSVTVINGAANSTATIYVGTGPIAIAVNPATNMIYVVNSDDNTVTVINGATNATTTVSVGTSPNTIAVDPVTNMIYVANENGTVTAINGSTNATTTITAGAEPHAIAVNPVTNKIYVANLNSNNVTVINGSNNSTTTVSAGSYPEAIAVNPVADKIYVANYLDSTVTVINGATNATGTINAGTGPIRIAVNPATNMIYVANLNSNNVTVINGANTPPNIPLLSTPTNGATNVPLNSACIWNSVNGATQYCMQLSSSTSFNSILLSDTIGTSSQGVSYLVNNKVYYWRVNASSFEGTSLWSSINSFTTIPFPPTAVTLISPSDNAVNVVFNPTLKWTTSATATAYTAQIAANTAFSYMSINANSSYDTMTVSLNAGIKYFWQVAATNAGGASAWAMDSFTTIAIAPTTPVLSSPSNGSTNIPLSTYLYWNASLGATSYRVQLCNSTAFVFVTDTTTSYTARAISGLSTTTTYYWRVNASNAYGTSLWSVVDSFTTVPGIPSVPVLVYPPNGSTNIPMNPLLMWNPCPGATTYEVQLSPYTTFTMLTDTIVTAPQRYAGVLTSYTTYYWHVDAINSYGTSSWAVSYTFTTGNVGVLNGPPRFRAYGLGYNGTLAVYSLDGRQVLKIPFTALATKEAVLQNTGKIPVKGFYNYQFLNDRKVMDQGNFVVK